MAAVFLFVIADHINDKCQIKQILGQLAIHKDDKIVGYP